MKVSDLRGILTYVHKFRDKTFVINLDSLVLENNNLSNLLLDISVLASLNIKIILVHGASQRMQKLSQQMNIKLSDVEGYGVTDDATLEIAILASNRLSHEILEGLNRSDLQAVISNAIIAHPRGIINGKDHQWTGKVEKIDIEFIKHLLHYRIIPVIPALGFDGEGKTYRVNSDTIACEISKAVGAYKLIFATNQNRINKGDVKPQEFSIEEAETYLTTNETTMNSELASKLRNSVRALQNGVGRAHILDGRQNKALLTEIFTNEGIGTMIHSNQYQSIRPATKKDIPDLWALMHNAIKEGELAPRTPEDISKKVSTTYVFEVDGNLIGCVSLVVSKTNPKIAEMGGLIVSTEHENQGIGKKLMKFVELRAKQLGVETVLALSTQAFNYFVTKAGYTEGTVQDLPEERRKVYEEQQRNSKILWKKIS